MRWVFFCSLSASPLCYECHPRMGKDIIPLSVLVSSRHGLHRHGFILLRAPKQSELNQGIEQTWKDSTGHRVDVPVKNLAKTPGIGIATRPVLGVSTTSGFFQGPRPLSHPFWIPSSFWIILKHLHDVLETSCEPDKSGTSSFSCRILPLSSIFPKYLPPPLPP